MSHFKPEMLGLEQVLRCPPKGPEARVCQSVYVTLQIRRAAGNCFTQGLEGPRGP